MKDFVAAERNYRAAMCAEPLNADFPFELAQLYWVQSKLDDVEKSLQDALAVDDAMPAARVSLVFLHSRKHELNRMLKAYQALMDQGKVNSQVMIEVGREIGRQL